MRKQSNIKHQTLKYHAIGMIGLLIIQYLLGMTTNLFVAFPQNEHGGQLWVFAWHQIPLALHIIIGFLLLFGTIALLIRSIILENKTWQIASGVALLAIAGAIAGGSTFIPTQTDFYSLIMAVGFIIAILAYFWGIYQDGKIVKTSV